MADQQEGTEGQVDDGNTPDDAAEETAARRNGWAPRDQWRGAPDEWMDFKEFNKRGREILPIVAAKNRRLESELGMTQRQLAELKKLAEDQGKTIKDLVDHGASEVARQVEEKLKELRADKRAAIREGNHELAADLEEQIDDTLELREKQKAKVAAAPVASPPAAPSTEPWAQAFGEANKDWLGQDEAKTAVFMAIADRLFKTTRLRGTELVEEAKVQMEAKLGGSKPAGASKSEPGGGGWTGSGGGGNRPGGKSFNDLPPDAKEQCRKQEAKFVGDSGKAFKTADAWRKHYAETYFASTNSSR